MLRESPSCPPANRRGTAFLSTAGSPSYRNFKDPIGLVLRMLRSGEPAAQAALLRAAVQLGLTPLDWALAASERRSMPATPGGESLPMVLVVGLPRSGTTLVYQQLARYLPFSWFDNLGALFPRAPLMATRLARPTFALSKASSRSFYGQTAGLRDVNDAFHVWNRWLGDDRYVVADALTASQVEDMRRFFAAWSRLVGRPLVNKNNRNAFCLGLLAKALPEALFVVVRREPLFVAQSLLEARDRVQGDRRIPWGLGARESEQGGFATSPDPLLDVVQQIRRCETRLSEEVRRVPPERLIRMEYEAFCRNPSAHLQRVADSVRARLPAWFDGVDHSRWDAPVHAAPIQRADRARLAPAEFERLRLLLESSSIS